MDRESFFDVMRTGVKLPASKPDLVAVSMSISATCASVRQAVNDASDPSSFLVYLTGVLGAAVTLEILSSPEGCRGSVHWEREYSGPMRYGPDDTQGVNYDHFCKTADAMLFQAGRIAGLIINAGNDAPDKDRLRYEAMMLQWAVWEFAGAHGRTIFEVANL